MKKYKAVNAGLLRKNLVWLLAAHIVFGFIEVFLYNFVLTVFLYELLLAWGCYYSYMTLSKYSTYLYIFGMTLMPVLGIYNFLAITSAVWYKCFAFVLQIGLYVYGGVVKLTQSLRRWLKAKEENEKKMKEKSIKAEIMKVLDERGDKPKGVITDDTHGPR